MSGRFINWLKVLYKEAESFPLGNSWVGHSFAVGSSVMQGCHALLSPLQKKESTIKTYRSLLPDLLGGNRLNLIKREVAYIQRMLGGLDMVNLVVFYTKIQSLVPLCGRAFSVECSCKEWFILLPSG